MTNFKDQTFLALEAIQVFQSAKNLDELFEQLIAYSKSQGLEYGTISPVINLASVGKDKFVELVLSLGRSNWPLEFQKIWVEREFIFHDPVVLYALRHRSTFSWDDVAENLTKMGREIFDTAAEFGLSSGISIPIHLRKALPGIVSFASPNMSINDLTEDQLLLLELVTTKCFMRLLELTEQEPLRQSNTLTPREMDVLYYVAGGKTNWEISKILGISENSVKTHLRNAAKRLGGNSRAHTVTLGITSGQIIP